MEDFQHDNLRDPSQQIRLLRILPADRREPIEIVVETFQRQSAPPYAALSYTWGDVTLLKRIAANGRFLDITQECWYALVQLRLFGISEYYWIDAICINQKDDLEKSAQVNLMGDTYRNATCTVASLGRQTKDIALFLRYATKMEIVCENAEACSDINIPGWLKALGETALERLFASLTAFARLPYWDRLWTAQEFALSSSLLIACGPRCLEWSKCDALNATICKLIEINKDWYAGKVALHTGSLSVMRLPMNRTGTLRSIVRSSPHGVATFTEVVLRLGTRKCLDPRDRIFGLLSLIHWPKTQPVLKADYRIPASKLAEIALEHADGVDRIAIAFQLCDLLEIPPSDPVMLSEARHRRLETSSLRWSLKSTSTPLMFDLRSTEYIQLTGREVMKEVSPKWKMLEVGLTYMLLPIFAQAGDIVLRFEIVESHHQAALLLRRHDNETYEIMGHVMLAPSPLATFSRPFATMKPHFLLYLTNDDLLFWTWQLRHGRGPCEFNGAMYERDPQWFETGFCSSPLRSYVNCYLFEEKLRSLNKTKVCSDVAAILLSDDLFSH